MKKMKTDKNEIVAPDPRIGTYKVMEESDSKEALLFENVYVELACDQHNNALKVLRPGAKKDGWETEVVICLLRRWHSVERVEESTKEPVE